MYQLADQTARSPERLSDDSYNLFSAETVIVPPGVCVPVQTGLILTLPTRSAVVIRSGPLICSHAIQTMNFSSLQLADTECSKPRLILYVCNLGCVPAKITQSDVIGNMCILSTKKRSLQCVNSDSCEVVELPTLKPKIADVRRMFIQKYTKDASEWWDRYLDDSILKSVTYMKKSARYQASKNKLAYEAKFVWKELKHHHETKKLIIQRLEKPKNLEIDINAL
jgi:dUTPase